MEVPLVPAYVEDAPLARRFVLTFYHLALKKGEDVYWDFSTEEERWKDLF